MGVTSLFDVKKQVSIYGLVLCLVAAKGFVELPAAYFLWSVPYEPSQCSNPHVVCASAHMVRANAIYFRTRRNIF